MIRGEFWTVAGGIYAAKPRPALVLQDDHFHHTASVTVAPLTTTLLDAALLRIRVAPSEDSGLEHPSDVMVDKLTTIRRTNVGSRIGHASHAEMTEVDRALMVFLGLAR